jgi:ribosomal protein S14
MNSLKEKKALLKKLEGAYTTCFDCGREYGVYSVGCSSVRTGECDVCGKESRVTEARDFGYFSRQIRQLKKEIKDEAKLS